MANGDDRAAESVRRALDEFLTRLARAVVRGSMPGSAGDAPADPPATHARRGRGEAGRPARRPGTTNDGGVPRCDCY